MYNCAEIRLFTLIIKKFMKLIYWLIFILFIGLSILPFYGAYLIISPNSFIGAIGAFLLGSILSAIILYISSIVLSIAGIFKK